ncbi:MAG: hypothetical protein JSR45_11620 [Proteobacteria bacterium]|nr:hypothetical protein [Pseudomonadota bacterium]
MKRPTPAQLKKVTPENLARLGPERLSELLMAEAELRPELKRRLRMELAGGQGPAHLAAELDKRLNSLATSRSRIGWRTRPAFLRELEDLRIQIAERLAALDRPMARERMWLFMGLARRTASRVRGRDEELAEVFRAGAESLGALLGDADPEASAEALVQLILADPLGWTDRLDAVLDRAPEALARAALQRFAGAPKAVPGQAILLRRLADAAGDIDAFRATFTEEALATPGVAAEVARRLLAGGRVEEAGQVLERAGPQRKPSRLFGVRAASTEIDFGWESVLIDYLEAAGRAEDAQAARWASFERTLSLERARAFVSRLPDFEDVEAETRAFGLAAAHADFGRGLAFLMDWPALPDAARMIQARPEEIRVSAENAELWAARLRARQPAAANLLLRKTAAQALRRGELAISTRLTQEADSIILDDWQS